MAAFGRRRGTFAEKSLPPAAGPFRRSAPGQAGKGRLITQAALAPPAPEVLRVHWHRPHAFRSPAPSPQALTSRPSAVIHYCVGGVAPTYRVFRCRPGFVLPKRKAPQRVAAGLWGKNPGDDLLSHARCTLPSARARFTSEFGMESGGSTQLLSPGRGWRVAGRSDGVIPWE